MWKKFALAVVLTSITAGSAFAQVYVKPYTRSDGTTVQGHYRSAPNNTVLDNYSTRGNVNPYTGQPGTVDPYGQRSRGSGYSLPYSKPYTSPYSSTGQSANDPN
jgi:hypothetical protein